MNTAKEKWLAERRTCIGASDAAAVLGVSPWKSPYALWAEKVYSIDVVEETQRMKWGTALEPLIAKEFECWAEGNIDWRIAVIDPGSHEIVRHPECDFIGATLDRVVYCEHSTEEHGIGTPIGVLEIKTTDGRNADEWADGNAPLHCQIQVQHQLAVTGYDMGWLAVLIGGNDFRVVECPRNDKFIAMLIEKEIEFWRLVESKTPPEVDGSDSTAAAIRALHPEDSGETIELDSAEWYGELAHLEELKEKVKEYRADIDAIENRLKAAIGAHTYCRIGDQVYSYKTQTRKAHEVAAGTFRVLRKKKGKA